MDGSIVSAPGSRDARAVEQGGAVLLDGLVYQNSSHHHGMVLCVTRWGVATIRDLNVMVKERLHTYLCFGPTHYSPPQSSENEGSGKTCVLEVVVHYI